MLNIPIMINKELILRKKAGWMKRIYHRAPLLYSLLIRNANCQKELKKIDNSGFYGRLTEEEKILVQKLWGKLRPDWRWFSFYNSIARGDAKKFDSRFVPLDVQYCLIDNYFNNVGECWAMDDKNMYDLYFYDVRMPKTIVHVVAGQCMDNKYQMISIEEAVRLCVCQKNVIIKPSYAQGAGCDIVFWSIEDGETELKNQLKHGENVVVQELIVQHPNLRILHHNSVNTIRIMTCFFEGVTNVLSAVVRIGAGDSKIDNASQGGLFCGLTDDGHLKKYAYDKTGQTFTQTPDGLAYDQCFVPNYDKCKELVLRLSNRFLRISKLTSWDLSIGEDGEPILVEVNLCNSGADILQIANGPLYGEKTKQIVGKAMQSKVYPYYQRVVR